MSVWNWLADRALPADVWRFPGGLDGYLPPVPAGMAWYRQSTYRPAPLRERRQGVMLVPDRHWWRLGPYPPTPPPRPRRSGDRVRVVAGEGATADTVGRVGRIVDPLVLVLLGGDAFPYMYRSADVERIEPNEDGAPPRTVPRDHNS